MDERDRSKELGKLLGIDNAKEAEISLLKDEIRRLKLHNAALRKALKDKDLQIKHYEHAVKDLKNRIRSAGEILSVTLQYPDD